MCSADGIIYPGYEYKMNNKDLVILPDVEEQTGKMTEACLKTLVVFIGGAADSLAQPLLRGVFVPYEKRYGERGEKLQDIAYSEHGGGRIAELIKKWADAGQKIVIIGHSWGGHRAICVAEANPDITIEYLATLDPVSWSKNGKQPKPGNVKQWTNIYVDYEVGDYSLPNIIARIGGPWQFCFSADFNESINSKIIDDKKIAINQYNHADSLYVIEYKGIKNDIIKI